MVISALDAVWTPRLDLGAFERWFLLVEKDIPRDNRSA